MTATAGKTAIIAGRGVLPGLLKAADPAALVCALEGFAPEGVAVDMNFRVERLVPFLNGLSDQGVVRVCFAGGVSRPRLDPSLFDPLTAQIVPRLLAAMQAGDDATLREVLGLFEEFGFAVVGAEAIAPDLLPGAGVLAGAITPRDEGDAARAEAIVAALGAVDVGQGCVVAQGLCLAVEALPGTDAMLAGVAALPPALRPDPARGKGLIFKAPKPGQDLRADRPALGPATVIAADQAGLGGVVWQAGAVLCLDLPAMQREASARGLFLWAR